MSNNGNMPAMPFTDSGFGQYEPAIHYGLSKLEEAAFRAMQGILSNPNLSNLKINEVAYLANAHAHALLKELDK